MMLLLQVSLSSGQVDRVFWFWMGVSALFLLAITTVMLVFVARYARGRGPVLEPVESNTWLEIVWTLVPTGLFLLIFYYGWTDYRTMRNPPRDALVVAVTARQWAWSFRYPNGKETAKLFAPLNRPIRLELRTADVGHGLFIPAFRLKVDAVPGHVGHAWFQAIRAGVYDLQCSVICGVDHSRMVTDVVVVPEAEFKAWYFAGEGAPEPVVQGHPGLAVLRAQGCLSCHSLEGSPGVGPTLKGLFGRREAVNGGSGPRWVVVDEARVRRAILDPDHEPVEGYPAVMPATPLEAGDLDALIAFLKELP